MAGEASGDTPMDNVGIIVHGFCRCVDALLNHDVHSAYGGLRKLYEQLIKEEAHADRQIEKAVRRKHPMVDRLRKEKQKIPRVERATGKIVLAPIGGVASRSAAAAAVAAFADPSKQSATDKEREGVDAVRSELQKTLDGIVASMCDEALSEALHGHGRPPSAAGTETATAGKDGVAAGVHLFRARDGGSGAGAGEPSQATARGNMFVLNKLAMVGKELPTAEQVEAKADNDRFMEETAAEAMLQADREMPPLNVIRRSIERVATVKNEAIDFNIWMMKNVAIEKRRTTLQFARNAPSIPSVVDDSKGESPLRYRSTSPAGEQHQGINSGGGATTGASPTLTTVEFDVSTAFNTADYYKNPEVARSRPRHGTVVRHEMERLQPIKPSDAMKFIGPSPSWDGADASSGSIHHSFGSSYQQGGSIRVSSASGVRSTPTPQKAGSPVGEHSASSSSTTRKQQERSQRPTTPRSAMKQAREREEMRTDVGKDRSGVVSGIVSPLASPRRTRPLATSPSPGRRPPSPADVAREEKAEEERVSFSSYVQKVRSHGHPTQGGRPVSANEQHTKPLLSTHSSSSSLLHGKSAETVQARQRKSDPSWRRSGRKVPLSVGERQKALDALKRGDGMTWIQSSSGSGTLAGKHKINYKQVI